MKSKHSLYATGDIPGATVKVSGKLSKPISGPWEAILLYIACCMNFMNIYIYSIFFMNILL